MLDDKHPKIAGILRGEMGLNSPNINTVADSEVVVTVSPDRADALEVCVSGLGNYVVTDVVEKPAPEGMQPTTVRIEKVA